MFISQKSSRVGLAGRFSRWSSCALMALLSVGFLFSSGTAVQAQRPVPTAAVFPPRHDTNAWFVDKQTGQPKYLVSALYATNFLGVPAVGGVWTDGVRIEAWAAVPTAVPGTWVWLAANGGPAGTFFPAPDGAPHRLLWQDNKGNCGHIITTP